MASILWHITMSLDGFIAGPDDTMDWVFEHGEATSLAEETMESTGALLTGRRWYDLAMSKLGGLEGIYGGTWTGPIFVLTHRPPDASPESRITFLSDDIDGAIATAREAAGGKAVGIFGANVAQQCLRAGLLDEIVIHLAPVLLGDGVRLYGGPGFGRIELERIAVAAAEQLTDLRFRVAKTE